MGVLQLHECRLVHTSLSLKYFKVGCRVHHVLQWWLEHALDPWPVFTLNALSHLVARMNS
jgi:hypothetical protein